MAAFTDQTKLMVEGYTERDSVSFPRHNPKSFFFQCFFLPLAQLGTAKSSHEHLTIRLGLFHT